LRLGNSFGQACNTVNRLDVAIVEQWLLKLAVGAAAGERD
jgi:hypothetical protein